MGKKSGVQNESPGGRNQYATPAGPVLSLKVSLVATTRLGTSHSIIDWLPILIRVSKIRFPIFFLLLVLLFLF